METSLTTEQLAWCAASLVQWEASAREAHANGHMCAHALGQTLKTMRALRTLVSETRGGVSVVVSEIPDADRRFQAHAAGVFDEIATIAERLDHTTESFGVAVCLVNAFTHNGGIANGIGLTLLGRDRKDAPKPDPTLRQSVLAKMASGATSGLIDAFGGDQQAASKLLASIGRTETQEDRRAAKMSESEAKSAFDQLRKGKRGRPSNN